MPSPIRFFEAISAHQLTWAIRAGVELEVFTAIAEGNVTAEGIAARTHASPKGIRILCDYLTVSQFLLKSGANYSLHPDTAPFLDKRSPAYMGGTVQFLLGEILLQSFAGLTGAVRKGGTMLGGHGTMDPDHPVWRDFARAMVPMMAMPAEFIAQTVTTSGPVKVLDIAAGHGLFGIALARHNPQAEVVAVDWDAVLDVAREHAQAAGVAARYQTLPGSAFDVEFGHGYDLVLFTNFFHHFDMPTCETLMRKAHAALKPDGRALTLEFAPDADRVSPPHAAMFALTMLASTSDGDAYTVGEYETMFSNAGFPRHEVVDVPSSPQRLIISYKRTGLAAGALP
ncbi:MAG: class I SAM-dependent methyltransferase [Bryobacterales bacterium]|nr:class I SAM-dependent methyltransferase [Bryobacterales bacterium]